MAKSIKTQLREIAAAETLSERQQRFIVEQSELMGVPFVVRKGCGNCYRDQAVVLWRTLCENEKSDGRKYLLRVGIDVIWKGRRINATCNDAELAELLALGFPREYFKRIDGEDGRWL